jgi:hypothetical protein
MANLSAILCGVAGEYFVAAELTRRGYIASITLRNTRGIDILASNETASRQVGLQVKSSQKNAREWILSRNAEDYFADNLFYAFVNLKTDQERPDFFIVPSKIVAESVKDGHARWLKAPGRHGQPHKDSNVRKFQDHDGEYLESWSLLSLEAVMNSGPHPPALLL